MKMVNFISRLEAGKKISQLLICERNQRNQNMGILTHTHKIYFCWFSLPTMGSWTDLENLFPFQQWFYT